MNRNNVSASGERAAICGYKAQFDIFATRVYDSLIKRDFVCFHAADDKLGNLDDIYYETTNEIHAYQIKWSVDKNKTITYLYFKEIFLKIISSWKLIKSSHSKPVIPYFVTCRIPSRNDSIKKSCGTKLGTFFDFIENVYIPLNEGNKISSDWIHVQRELFDATSNISKEEFNSFWRSFVFKHSYEEENILIENSPVNKRFDDILSVYRVIVQMVGSRSRIVECKFDEIIRKLNWGDRFKTIFNHNLQQNLNEYEPIDSTISELNLKINKLDSGYIFLQGTPGSGKSTLLSEWTRQIENEVISFYAYDFTDPSSQKNCFKRGEINTFLHDIVLMLDNAGYKSDSECLHVDDFKHLQDCFYKQINKMSEAYTKDNQKRIIIIDGLDHVPREYAKHSSNFIEVLPNPKEIPIGVIIVLGSQNYKKLKGLSNEILNAYTKDRIIIMSPLSEAATALLLKKMIPSITFNVTQLKSLYQNTQGHPLYTQYIIKILNDSNNLLEVLDHIPKYSGDIEIYYKNILGDALNNAKLRDMLGLIARIDSHIRWAFVKEWGADIDTIQLFVEYIKPLLHVNDTLEIYHFFHNSFRQFLRQETALDVMTNNYDESINIDYFSRLATYYMKSKIEPTWKAARYLYYSGRYDDFIAFATPSNLEKQLCDFRSLEDVKNDAQLGVSIAKERKDVYLLVRYLLFLSELEQRKNQEFSSIDIHSELYDMGKKELGMSLILEDNRILCNNKHALEYAKELYFKGNVDNAKRLFDLSFPPFVYTNGKDIWNGNNEFENKFSILEAWVSSATLFMNYNQIQEKYPLFLSCLNTVLEKTNESIDERWLSKPLDFQIALTWVEQKKYTEIDNWISNIDHTAQDGFSQLILVYRELLNTLISQKNISEARRYYNKFFLLCNRRNKTLLNILLAKFGIEIGINKDIIVPLISNPAWDKLPVWNSDKHMEISHFRPWYRLIKMRRLYGIKDNVASLIISNQSTEDQKDDWKNELIMQKFVRNIGIIAQMESDAILNTSIPNDFQFRCSALLSVYHSNNFRNRYWHNIKNLKKNYVSLLISVAKHYGPNGLSNLASLFEQEFSKFNNCWSIEEQRNIIELFYSAGYDKDCCICSLSKIEEKVLQFGDISERVNNCVSQARIWQKFDDNDRALVWYKNAIRETFNIGYRKDYQPSLFVEWIDVANKVDPNGSIERLKWFLKHLNEIQEVTEGNAHWRSVEKILQKSFKLNSNTGLSIGKWLIDTEHTTFVTVFTAIMVNSIERIDTKENYLLYFFVYTKVYLNFNTNGMSDVNPNPDIELLNKIIKKGLSLYGSEFSTQYEPQLIQSINTQVIAKYRLSLLNKIEECLRPKQTDKENIEKVTDEKRYLYRKKEECSEYWIEKGRMALSSGDTKEAIDNAQKALSYSSSSGWIKYYDGGSCISAFQLLIDAGAPNAKEKAFNCLADDIDIGNSYGIMQNINEILPIIADGIDPLKIYNEQTEYMKRILRDDSVSPKDCLDITIGSDDAIIIITKFLLFANKFYISSLSEKISTTFPFFIDNGRKDVFDLVTKTKDNNLIMNTAKYLCEKQSTSIDLFKETANNLVKSTNFKLRICAQDILAKLNISLPIITLKILPITYTLTIPNQESSYKNIHEKDNSVIRSINWNNPHDIMLPCKHMIEYLSNISGFNTNNITYRAATLMNSYGSLDEWDENSENNLRNHLSAIGLKYPYLHPYAVAAINGVMEVATELIDAGRICPIELFPVFNTYDYAVNLWNEVVRPSFVLPLDTEEFTGVKKGWEKTIETSPRWNKGIIILENGDVVIGEISQLMYGANNFPCEKYMETLSCSNSITNKDDFFDAIPFNLLTKDYVEYAAYPWNIIVIHKNGFTQFTQKSSWIAFNPVLAKKLGWKPSNEGLFAWNDHDGNRMVESIYWRDGNTEYRERYMSEVGEGWYIVARSEAIEILKKIFPDMVQKKQIERFYLNKLYDVKKQVSIQPI